MKNLEFILHKLQQGKMVVVVDDADRENEGDLVMAAEKVTPKDIAFMASEGRGLICVPLTKKRANELDLVPMTEQNTAPLRCNFTVSVDIKKGITTGISANDRAKTILAIANKSTKPDSLARPGHVFPLIANEAGVFGRRGHTEGAVELMRLAGLKPISVICEIMGADGQMLRGKTLHAFAKKNKLPIISIDEIVEACKRLNNPIKRVVVSSLPTEYGNAKIYGYQNMLDKKEHIALVMGDISKSPPLVRLHSECLTGDVFHSMRCDCRRQLDVALKRISKEKCGVLIYLRHEGRGIGLLNKLKAYNLQDQGLDTVEANLKLGFKGDERDYGIAAQILDDLDLKEVRLMTNNPDKISSLKKAGVKIVKRLPLEIKPSGKKDLSYLKAKKKKMGHLLSNI